VVRPSSQAAAPGPDSSNFVASDQIKKTNVSRLTSKWIFSLPKTASLKQCAI
jgi:hypothetical protein